MSNFSNYEVKVLLFNQFECFDTSPIGLSAGNHNCGCV